MKLKFASIIVYSLASPCLMDPRGLWVTQNAYFSLSTQTKKLLSVTFCDTTAEILASFWTHGTGTTEPLQKLELVFRWTGKRDF